MSHLIERRAVKFSSRFEPANIVFDLSKEGRDILDVLTLHTPPLCDAFEFLQTKLPLPRNAIATMESHFYRLPGHNRSYCYSLTQNDSFFDSPVLVFKGTEPLLNDFPVLVDWMLQAPLRRSRRVMADHFPFAEGKIPGVLTLKEASREAEIALDIQRKHLRYYQDLARIPTPLLIHGISSEKRDRCAVILQQKLSQAAFERIEPLLLGGLAIYIYYYPSAPIRSNYWGSPASTQLTQHIQRAFDEEAIVSAWVKLMVRLLYLGYLPYSVRNEGLGACMDIGNAVLDGGFCDPDSIVPIDTSPDDEFFREAIVQSLSSLHATIQLTLGLSNRSDLYSGIEEFVCNRYLHRLIDDAVASEKRPELDLDDRFTRLMSPRTIADLKENTSRKKREVWYTQFVRRTTTM